ncbi:helix-turn-helix transcriptional regulator [Streptomyces xanthochromogenes]|uniref:helix-turn-helix transcriptional regulator n=1 Tax=Streptomyces xanthochromogenes TaxID=67384 RepID=UPI0037F21ECF
MADIGSGQPEREEGLEPLTIAEIEARFGVSRQTIHRLRAKGVFPHPVPTVGSTRMRFDAREVEDFFAVNPKRPGRRTDLDPQRSDGSGQ